MSGNVLMILHAREIPECIAALKSLKITKAWFRGYTEFEVQSVLNQFIRRTDFENYIIISDDCIPKQEALDSIQRALQTMNVATGWSKISPQIDHVNIRLKPMVGEYNQVQSIRLVLVRTMETLRLNRLIHWVGASNRNPFYRVFPTSAEIESNVEIFRTYYVGWSLTGMRREVWLKYPFSLQYDQDGRSVQHGSDYSASRRMNEDGIPMYCIKAAYVEHLKSMENFIVGKVKKEVILEA